MIVDRQDAPDADGSGDDTATPGVDPRDTDHPAGAEQEAQNVEDESPS